MTNKELRHCILVKYEIYLRRKFYWLFLTAIYFLLGIIMGVNKDHSSDLIMVSGVFSIIGISVLAIFDTTRHEKSQYIVPISYMERKKLFLIAVLINFTMCFLLSILFILICFLLSREYGILSIKMFTLMGLPYLELISFNKIYMYKGKRKKDNPLMVYVEYFIGFVAGLAIVYAIFSLENWINKMEFNIIVVLVNLVTDLYIGRVIYRIITGDTSFENVKVNQIKVVRKVL